jgi:hypothetical protein
MWNDHPIGGTDRLDLAQVERTALIYGLGELACSKRDRGAHWKW